jgi:DNA polymerase bacteriophage-type
MLDLDRCLYLDFEARSEVDIGEVGAHAYAEHPTTELLCCAWVLGLSAPVELWLPWEPLPAEWRHHNIRNYTWVAHNKDTERCLLRHKLGMVIPSERWVDCATVTSAAGMPRNLRDVAESLRLEVQKGSRTALLALAKPRKLSKKNAAKWWTCEEKPETYQQLYDYCRTDTDVMRKALAALPPYHWVMPAREERLAVLTDKMNDLGVEVDLAGVDKAHEAVEAHGAQLRARFAELYPGVNPRHAPSVSAALGMPNARKEVVRDELKAYNGNATSPRHEALTLLKTIKTASTAKLKAFRRHACADGRVHGAMVFHGAGRTGRWSSMGVQLHNLVRGLSAATPDWPAIDTSPDAMDIYFDMLHSGILDVAYRDPTRATAAAMRGFLLDTQTGLLSGDYSQIEARVLVAWAGQTDMVEAFRQKRDPYKLMAARIYNKSIESINKDERFMGKQSVLGAGYGVGKHGFLNMLKEIYDIDITEEESERIVYAYRTSNQRVVNLWYAVERLAKQTLLEQPQRLICATDVPRIAMRMVDKWLVIRLPSGRCLWYFEPELVRDGGRSRIIYWGRNIRKGGRWDRVETYGGKLVENCTQAIARDVMADGMLRLDERDFNVNMTVHDEVVAPGPASRLEEFESIMRVPPAWWPELPLDVEVQHKRRYQK